MSFVPAAFIVLLLYFTPSLATLPIGKLSFLPNPWGWYSAANATSTTLYDLTGNNRDATMIGVTLGSGAGNGAGVIIPYISGTQSSTITWPSGSIPSTFTICSITRYASSAAQTGANKLLVASGITDWFHGHWGGTVGVVDYGGTWVAHGTSGGSTFYDWQVVCATNRGSVPTNMYGQNIARGEQSGGSGSGQLCVNANQALGTCLGCQYQPSDFGFAQVIIWDTALSSTNMATASTYLTNYLAYGTYHSPTMSPTPLPSSQPSRQPTMQPTTQPSQQPSSIPTQPSPRPSGNTCYSFVQVQSNNQTLLILPIHFFSRDLFCALDFDLTAKLNLRGNQLHNRPLFFGHPR